MKNLQFFAVPLLLLVNLIIRGVEANYKSVEFGPNCTPWPSYHKGQEDITAGSNTVNIGLHPAFLTMSAKSKEVRDSPKEQKLAF